VRAPLTRHAGPGTVMPALGGVPLLAPGLMENLLGAAMVIAIAIVPAVLADRGLRRWLRDGGGGGRQTPREGR
jgi:hypothetical protein